MVIYSIYESYKVIILAVSGFVNRDRSDASLVQFFL